MATRALDYQPQRRYCTGADRSVRTVRIARVDRSPHTRPRMLWRVRRLSIALLALGAIEGCGPRARATEPAATKRVVGGPPVASSFDVQLSDDVVFAFRVTNSAPRKLELTFPSGLTHDITVVDTVGREVWRWSDGRLYTQTLQNRVLDANETLAYEASWHPDSLRGTFVAVASLRSENYPIEQRVRFTLP